MRYPWFVIVTVARLFHAVLFGVVQGESLAPLLRPTKHLVLFALSAVFLSLFL